MTLQENADRCRYELREGPGGPDDLAVQREDAEAVIDALTDRVDRRGGWETTAFELQRVWIERQGEEYCVNVVYRQRGELWSGFRRSSLAPWVYQDHLLTPAQVADDIYDFVLVEPTETPTWLPADNNGVHWWPEHDRPIQTGE